MFNHYFGHLKILKTHTHAQINSLPSQNILSFSDSFLMNTNHYPSNYVTKNLIILPRPLSQHAGLTHQNFSPILHPATVIQNSPFLEICLINILGQVNFIFF